MRTRRDRAGRKRSSFCTAAIEAARSRSRSRRACSSPSASIEFGSVLGEEEEEEEEEEARWEGFERRQRTV